MLINDKRRGQVYSISADLNRVPDAFRYRLSSRIRRMDEETMTTAPYQQVASQTKHPEERLRLALESGLQVNALDGLFWLDPANCRRHTAASRVGDAGSVVGCRSVRFTDRDAQNRDGIPSLTRSQFLKAG